MLQFTDEKSFALPPRAENHISLEDCGIIHELRVESEPALPEVLRGLRLRITWDAASEPSVDVPIGYLFGQADHTPLLTIQYSSLLVGASRAEGYTQFPMPFARGA